jgi:hypothetical protein
MDDRRAPNLSTEKWVEAMWMSEIQYPTAGSSSQRSDEVIYCSDDLGQFTSSYTIIIPD